MDDHFLPHPIRSRTRARKEERDKASEEAFQKKQAHFEARAAAKDSVDERIKILVEPPVEDFMASTHHPLLRRITYIMCDIWAGRDWKGEIDSFLTSVREGREENMETGMDEYYLALRVAVVQIERMKASSKWIGDIRRGPDNATAGEGLSWTEVGRKLDRVLRLLSTEQTVVLNLIRKDSKDSPL